MDYVKISNSGVLWLLCGVTVIISFVQALLYMRMAKKNCGKSKYF